MKRSLSLIGAILLLAPTLGLTNNAPVPKSVAKVRPLNMDPLALKFKLPYKNKEEFKALKKEVLSMAGKAVPTLVQVMKSSEFPDRNRWMATFLLGRIMGKKASPFLAKFVEHPSWILRLAALKTLMALKQKKYGPLFAKALKDKSYIVRTQALENIRVLGLSNLSHDVWKMLFDKRNYYNPKNKEKKTVFKKTNIIKDVIKTVGDLKFTGAKDALLKMSQKKKYNDIFNEIDYSLSKILKKSSPDGARKIKRIFWSRIALAETKI